MNKTQKFILKALIGTCNKVLSEMTKGTFKSLNQSEIDPLRDAIQRTKGCADNLMPEGDKIL